MNRYRRIAKLKTVEEFQAYVQELGIQLPFAPSLSSGPSSPLGQTLETEQLNLGNRFCILPMEGWDATRNGKPTELTRRRWRRFGQSGAKLIWGGEAVAVRPDGRANPNQLMINDANLTDLESLKKELEAEHQRGFGSLEGLSIGLQLTHSGRFARPNEKSVLEPRTVYRHPVLDEKFQVESESAIMDDSEIEQLIDAFVSAAVQAQKCGFGWVDIKHCHGYFGHELLSGYDRPGKFGGSLENRSRFLKEIVAGIRAEAPGLQVGVRLSLFDYVPFQPGEDRVGIPSVSGQAYRYAFGGDSTGCGIDLDEPREFVRLMQDLGIELICTTAGSPYYNPHIQRPAIFPPSDGYLPPEDPLVGVARQIQATGELKEAFSDRVVVGSGYSYLQDWLPNVAQEVVKRGLVDVVGLGRMVLSYPEMPADILEGKPLQRKKICRTFSDCTTAPRNGMISGCYPLDEFYKQRDEYKQLVQLKKQTP